MKGDDFVQILYDKACTPRFNSRRCSIPSNAVSSAYSSAFDSRTSNSTVRSSTTFVRRWSCRRPSTWCAFGLGGRAVNSTRINLRFNNVSGGRGIHGMQSRRGAVQASVMRHRHVATHVGWRKAGAGHGRRRSGSHNSQRKAWDGRREPVRKHLRRPTHASNERDGRMQETAEAQRTDFVGLARRLPAQRILIWGGVALTAYELKEFTGIAIGSFILCFLGNSIIDWAQTLPAIRRVPPSMRRKLLVVSYFSLIVLLVVGFGCLTVPNVLREGTDFISRLQNENMWIVVTDKMRQGLGDTVMNNLERFLMASSAGFEGEILPPTLNTQPWTQERVYQLGLTIQKALRGYTSEAVSVITTLLLATTRITLQVLVSLALSFMIVWDLPRISLGVQSLAQSRLKPIYNEVAPSFISFGRLFGKALQAQATIACVNTALTCAGICLLALPGVVFLTLFVFICSFIPIAGCFISTVPIAFVALTEYGFIKVALVFLMVVVIHFLEAYVLNPAIYAQHLKLHPLLVLTVLVVAESMFGVWGLLLAVPLTVFALDYCIRYPASSLEEVCAAEETNITPFESPTSPM